ncbi:MAG: hypothetical protein WA879_14780, partial [Candidatus Acidiferrales bacterium]
GGSIPGPSGGRKSPPEGAVRARLIAELDSGRGQNVAAAPGKMAKKWPGEASAGVECGWRTAGI